MTDREFEIGGRKFKLLKIDAFKQFHIIRRLGPVLSDLLPAMKGVNPKVLETMSEEEKLDRIAKFVTPIMTGLSKLSDEDSDLVLFGLLHAVEVQQVAGNWARVASGSTPPMLMIQDMDLPVLLQLAGRAFIFNLSGFFTALPR